MANSGGYDFDKDKNSPISVTSEVPTDRNGQYTFLAWYNKNYDKKEDPGSHNSANNNNNGKPFTFPEGEVYFGDTNTVFSLDAVWGRIAAQDKRVTYTGDQYGLDSAQLKIEGGNGKTAEEQKTNILNALKVGMTVTYSVSVEKDGESTGAPVKGELSDSDTIPLPTNFTDVGTYKYTVSVTFVSKQNSANTVEISTTATLIIDPVLELSVSKKLDGRDWKAGDKFTFQLTAPDGNASLSEPKSVEITGKDQTASFGYIAYQGNATNDGSYTLRVSETPGSETGMTYADPQTITVAVKGNASGPYTLSVDNVTLDSSDSNVYRITLPFTNTSVPGHLTVTKTVAGKDADQEKKFSFTVKLPNEPLTGTYGGMTFTNGEANFELAHGDHVTATDLPAGIKYTVTEAEDSDYTVSSENEEGTIESGKTITASFTNTLKTGNLTVHKTITGGGPDRAFRFTVTLGKTLSGTYGDMTFTNGVASFTLANGENATATGLPVGTSYTVKEDASTSYTSSLPTGGQTGTIQAGETAQVNVTNTWHTGGLTVTKVVSTGGNTHRTFTIYVTLNDNNITGTYGEMEFSNGQARLQLTHGQSATATKLPAGLSYTVTEEPATGYQVTYPNSATGTIPADGSAAQVTVVNTYKGGTLRVTKTVVDDPPSDEGKEFTFTVKLNDETVHGPRGSVNFEGGVTTFTLKKGESKEIPGLPAGASYTVTEKDAGSSGYVTSSSGSTGTIPDNNVVVTAAFTNTYRPGELVIHKKVEGKGADTQKEFTFTVTLDGHPECNDQHGQLKFKNGEATFTLTDGDSITATGLPAGGYTVTETSDDDYVTTVNGSQANSFTGSLSEGSHSATVNFINRYKTGDLSITKTVSGTGFDPARDFQFTVTLGDKTINGTYGDLNFTNGTATFTLHHGETKTAQELPNNTTYTVTETDANQHGYQIKEASKTGTIRYGATSTVSFVNEYHTGGLTVEKVLTPGGNTTRDFNFTVTLTNEPLTGTYGDMKFENGVAKFTRRGGQSFTATGLPAGTGYTVTETDSGEYQVSYKNQTGTIPDGGTVTATVTNHYPAGSLTVSKTVVGTGNVPDQEFHFTVTLSGTGADIHGPRDSVSFDNGTTSFTLKSGESKTIPGLPAHAHYTVTEAEANQGCYTTTSVGESGSIPDGGDAIADFTNTYTTGNLSVTKATTGDGANKTR